MIFLGDFVYPFEEEKNILNFDKKFLKEEKMLNLESLLLDPSKHEKLTKGIALYSTEYMYSLLKKLNVKAVGLANNHITDFKYDISSLKQKLLKKDIQSCGAGENFEDAIKPVLIEDEKYKYVVYSFGWDVIGCKYANTSKQGTAPLDEKIAIQCTKDAKVRYADRKIIIFLHWNIEYEYYPQPADRKMAFSLIDAGADAIIGHHPHIVGVYEEYKKKPIFYSIGNFFLPDYTYQGFKIESSERSLLGLGVKYHELSNEIELFWIKSDNKSLHLEKSEKLNESDNIEVITDLYQNDLSAYKKWFKVHRRKKKLLPIYETHEKTLKNRILFELLELRNYIVHNITAIGLRKKNN